MNRPNSIGCSKQRKPSMKFISIFIFISSFLGLINLKASEFFDHVPEVSHIIKEAKTLHVQYLPWSISTISRVTPELLERIHEYEFVNKNQDSQPAVVKEFVAKIGGKKFQKSNGENIDCRWAFTLKNKNKIVTVYFNSNLTEGFMLGYKFEPDELFKGWVNDRFGAVFGIDEGL